MSSNVSAPGQAGARPPGQEEPVARGTARPAGEDEPPVDRNEPAVDLLLSLVSVLRSMRSHPVGLATLRSALADRQLAGRHVAALLFVALRGPMTVSALADALGVARTTASLLVAELGEAGLVERSVDEHDRRRTVVSLSADHSSEVDKVLEARLEPLRRAAERLGADTIATVVGALGVIAEDLQRHAMPSGPCAGPPAPPSSRRAATGR